MALSDHLTVRATNVDIIISTLKLAKNDHLEASDSMQIVLHLSGNKFN